MRARWVAAALLAGVAVLPLPVLPQDATAAESPLLTTSSTRTVAWTDQAPRDPRDEVPAVRDALEDWELRVSQTRDLLNQTVQVTWTGGATGGNGTFLQLMQCWSDGPGTSPTREQCGYGGIDREGADGTGAARTRALGRDPRERTYRYDGDLVLATVDGTAATRTWTARQQVELGTFTGTCPAATTAWRTTLVPHHRLGLRSAVLASGEGAPAPVTAASGTTSRSFPAGSGAFALAAAAAELGLRELPQGVYRVELACLAGNGTTAAAFMAWLARPGSDDLWRVAPHEGGVFVPFDPQGSGPDLAPTDAYERDEVLDFLKPRSSNDIWHARNNPSGGGEAFFEVQTDLEAQHLGCGRVEAAGVRSCWLVAVPRWAGDPSGEVPATSELASPLSQTLWDRRIEVPLHFAPVAAGCRIGSGLKQVLTNDVALSALRSWQPAYCGSSATAASVLGPLPDSAVRAGIGQPNRFGVVGVPDEGRPTEVVLPLATAGVVIGFSLDKVIPYGTGRYAENGTRETELNLSARLVAKLLTQSYDSGAAPNGGKASGYNASQYSGFTPTFVPARSFPADNPRTMLEDPEFRALNPQIASWLELGGNANPQDLADVLVSANDADAYQALWRWVLADGRARAFLAGRPDPYGMRVNPYYRNQITEGTTSFPQLDPTCADTVSDPAADAFPLLCQGNLHPRVEDDSKAAQAAVRGDTRRVDVAPLVFDEVSAYRAQPRQEVGRRALLVVTTSPVAARYGLPVAALENASGRLVTPTVPSMSAARKQMKARRDGVLVPQPGAVTGEGYPLTVMSYAVVDVAATTPQQNAAFARMLGYALDEGQTPGTAVGQLPPGYAPLTPALAARGLQALELLADPSSVLPSPEPAPATGTGPGAHPARPVPGQVAGPLVPGAPDLPTAGPLPVPPATAADRVAATATPAARAAATWLLHLLVVTALLAGLAGRVLAPGPVLPLPWLRARLPIPGASGAGRTARTTSSPRPALPPESENLREEPS